MPSIPAVTSGAGDPDAARAGRNGQQGQRSCSELGFFLSLPPFFHPSKPLVPPGQGQVSSSTQARSAPKPAVANPAGELSVPQNHHHLHYKAAASGDGRSFPTACDPAPPPRGSKALHETPVKPGWKGFGFPISKPASSENIQLQ